MLSLRLFGGLTLSGPDGTVTSRASQRRRLALLAILAHARGRPVSRDKVMALLWPEADAERARHLLADSIYVLRDTLGDDVLVTVGDDVALNAERVSSDLEAFLHDLETGALPAAVDRYAQGGPFLDGVHLGDAPEFERWVEAVGPQLAEQYRRALESLATDAGRQGDRAGAIAYWRRLAAEDRLSSRVALGLMRALADAGDVAGALEFARTHERVVRGELETPPDPAVIAFAQELRAMAVARPKPASAAVALPGTPAEAAGAVTRPRRIVPYGIAALLVLVVTGASFGAWRLWRGSPSGAAGATGAERSIVVLPLVAADPRDAALADGLTDELIAVLGKTGLRVTSHTSAFAFKGVQMDVRRIADTLHVSHVLEGSLQQSGSRLRVKVMLVDAQDGKTRWSEVYDRETKDVFAVQDDIAYAVARQLDVRLGGSTRTNVLLHQPRNMVAREWYRRALDADLFRTHSGVKVSADYFKRAIRADSTYAAAYAGLAHQYLVLGFEGTEKEPRRVWYTRAETLAQKAVALDDSLPEAHVALGFARMRLLKLASADSEVDRALTLGPIDPLFRAPVIYVYSATGQYEKALVAARRDLEDDRLSAVANLQLASALAMNDRCDEALAQLEHIADVRPRLPPSAQTAAKCYIRKRMWPEAIAALRGWHRTEPRQQSLLAYALARSGHRDEARQILDSLLARWRNYKDDSFELALAYAGLGELDESFRWLDRSVDDLSLGVHNVETTMEEIRTDPRWGRLRQRLGLQNR